MPPPPDGSARRGAAGESSVLLRLRSCPVPRGALAAAAALEPGQCLLPCFEKPEVQQAILSVATIMPCCCISSVTAVTRHHIPRNPAAH